MNNNYQFPVNQLPGYNQIQQIQQMFPQPQGSVYQINSPAEVGNVPIGSTGLSVAICFQEQLMYIKSFQNGSPIIMAYRVSPYAKEESAPVSSPAQTMEDRLSKIETMLNSMANEGGKFNGLL